MLPASALALHHLDEVLAIENQIYPFPWTRGNFQDGLNAGYDLWGCKAYENGPILAYFVAAPVVDEIHLLNLSVAPQMQGKGFGRALLEQFVQRYFELGMEAVLLEVRPSNLAARALYEKFGFLRIGVRRGYYPGPSGAREDALVMRYLLKQWAAAPSGAKLLS